MSNPTMNSTTPSSATTSNRGPYIAAAAFFLLLMVVGALALVPKLRHRDDLRLRRQRLRDRRLCWLRG